MRHPVVVEELRRACAEIARRAGSVRIEPETIAAYAASLPIASPATADVGGPRDADPDGGFTREERARYWLSLDAINFGSGWFPTLRKDAGASGSMTIAGAWRAQAVAEGPFPAAALVALEPADVARILGQDPDHELMELYALSLRDLGTRLGDGFGASATALVDAADGSAVALAQELGGWPCFADRSRFAELSVPFLKRAQIAAADLRRAGVAHWHDTARLTMFADNLVPHVLRMDGVLSFAAELVARIDAGELIAHGDPEEVEIRACALHAVELIVAARNDGTTAADVDELLWNRGRDPFYKARPRHRSRCTAY